METLFIETKALAIDTPHTSQLPVVQLDETMYTSLYDEVYPVVASIISRQGGTLAEAEDIFQDALIVFMDQARLTMVQDPARYIVGIAKHLWMRRARKENRFLKLDDYEQSLHLPEEVASEVSSSALLLFLQRAGNKCMDLLSDFYFAGLSIAQLSVRHGFTTRHSTAVQKHKCLEKIRTIVKEKQLSHEDFLE
jgi:DNA-directed RNA polymerase specialized sigma24 family protein